MVKDFRKELLEAARGGRTVTYGRLTRRCGLSRGRQFAKVLNEVDRDERLAGAPGFAAIVVRKDTGYPGGGYFCDDDLPTTLRRQADRRTDPRLSAEEERYVIKQQEKVWDYYRKGRRKSAATI